MLEDREKQKAKATRSLFNIKKNRKSVSVEPKPLSMKVININNFKNLFKKQPVRECPEQMIYKNRVETTQSRPHRGVTQGHNRIYIKNRKEHKNDELNFSDYKIKFGKDIEDIIGLTGNEDDEQLVKTVNNKGNKMINGKSAQIDNYFDEPINQQPLELPIKEAFKPKGRIVFKRQVKSKSERRSNLPNVKINSSYQNYRKRMNIMEDAENQLDGWKDQNPVEELQPKLDDISLYTGKWELRYQYMGKANR